MVWNCREGFYSSPSPRYTLTLLMSSSRPSLEKMTSQGRMDAKDETSLSCKLTDSRCLVSPPSWAPNLFMGSRTILFTFPISIGLGAGEQGLLASISCKGISGQVLVNVVQTGLKVLMRPPVNRRCTMDRKTIRERGNRRRQKGGSKVSTEGRRLARAEAKRGQSSSSWPSAPPPPLQTLCGAAQAHQQSKPGPAPSFTPTCSVTLGMSARPPPPLPLP